MAITSVNITPETEIEVLTLSQAKLQLRIEDSYTAEDDLIESYINSAIASSENYINGHIQPKTLTIKYNEFFTAYEFDTYPISAITISYYKKGASTLTTLPTTDWHTVSVNKKHNVIVIDLVPQDVAVREDAVIIEATLGYEDAEDVPAPIITAIKLQVSDMFERREDRAGTPIKVSQTLLRPYRNYL